MNATVHSEISVKKHGGKIEDYYPIHDFADCSKEIESTNKHRVYFHTMWGVKNCLIPIFGTFILNSDGKKINTKDLCESDHILPDYRGKFIPTLIDFIDCVSDDVTDKAAIEQFQKETPELFIDPKIKELMMSPWQNTGKVKSLLLTHNSWFVSFVLPKIFKDLKIETKDFSINPSRLFHQMVFKQWMQNGAENPPSYKKTVKEEKNILDTPFPPQVDEQVIDGVKPKTWPITQPINPWYPPLPNNPPAPFYPNWWDHQIYD